MPGNMGSKKGRLAPALFAVSACPRVTTIVPGYLLVSPEPSVLMRGENNHINIVTFGTLKPVEEGIL